MMLQDKNRHPQKKNIEIIKMTTNLVLAYEIMLKSGNNEILLVLKTLLLF